MLGGVVSSSRCIGFLWSFKFGHQDDRMCFQFGSLKGVWEIPTMTSVVGGIGAEFGSVSLEGSESFISDWAPE